MNGMQDSILLLRHFCFAQQWPGSFSSLKMDTEVLKDQKHFWYFNEAFIADFLTKLLEWKGFALLAPFNYSFYLTQLHVFNYNLGRNRAPLNLDTVGNRPIELVSVLLIYCRFF